ncbi:hypothetical protein SynRS9909_01303 [Synechococcus sp. RS9909]|nr:hypothetical protein RS9917_13443 [Synechococcus sp. RS9917]QNI79290.1 hypothetical protein SynRS9909_01303 [Synechococcus sp. RS9909]
MVVRSVPGLVVGLALLLAWLVLAVDVMAMVRNAGVRSGEISRSGACSGNRRREGASGPLGGFR